MKQLKRISDQRLYSESGQREFILDIRYEENGKAKPVIIFVHGFKGFKDWGCFPLMAEYFASRGYIFLKFNFSHNGTTIEHPVDFADLEAFGRNRYSMELDEIGYVLDYVESSAFPVPESEWDGRIFQMGHSRGGGISIAKTANEERIHALATLAAVADLGPWNEEDLAGWKEAGVHYIHNSRTQQEMPLYFSLAEDFEQHREKLVLTDLAPKIKVPWLIVHGTNDETVPLEQGERLHEWNPGSEIYIIEGAGHTFEGMHPFEGNELPENFRKALEAVDGFFKGAL